MAAGNWKLEFQYSNRLFGRYIGISGKIIMKDQVRQYVSLISVSRIPNENITVKVVF